MPARKKKVTPTGVGAFRGHTKAQKINPADEALCSLEQYAAEAVIDRRQVITLLAEIRDGSKGHVELKADTETVKHDLFRQQLALNQQTVELLIKLVEGQKALADTIMLLTAKGVAKAPKEKKVEPPTPQEIVAGVNQAGREMAQAQRDALASPPPAPEEKKPPELKVVPPLPTVAPSVASPGTGPGPSSESAKAPTLDELRTAFLQFIAKNTREKGVALLQDFGAMKITDVPPAQYARFAAKCV